eukprot:17982-Heterococcus_DN1.PRE.1
MSSGLMLRPFSVSAMERMVMPSGNKERGVIACSSYRQAPWLLVAYTLDHCIRAPAHCELTSAAIVLAMPAARELLADCVGRSNKACRLSHKCCSD